MPLHTLGSLIDAAAELKALKTLACWLDELQSTYKAAVLPELARASRVKSCSAGTLYVAADNAAVAAKLKQLLPRLLAAIRATHGEITHIHINVSVSGRESPRAYESKKQALTPFVIGRLDELAGRIQDSALKAALARLARRHDAHSRSTSFEHPMLEHKQNHDDGEQNEQDLEGTLGPDEVIAIAGVEKKPKRDRNRKQR
jgi:hypothetical protein